MKETNFIKSPLNYTGGKFKLLPQIIPLFPKNIHAFIEPFSGGCQVGINAKCNKIICSDTMPFLSDLLNIIKNESLEDLLKHIDTNINTYNLSKENQEGYLQLRTKFNTDFTKDMMDLYTLICYAFNNQIRFNSNNEYNMPFGKNRSSFNPSLRQKFIDFKKCFDEKNITFLNLDFKEMLDKILNKTTRNETNNFFYFDPPYFNSIASYNEQKGWTQENENDLRRYCVILNSKGYKWALSNNLIVNIDLESWALNNNFNIHYLYADYSNCNYHKKNKAPDSEVLITNY